MKSCSNCIILISLKLYSPQIFRNLTLISSLFEVLIVLRDIIPLAGTESTKRILNAISSLLVSAELDMRLCIGGLLEGLAEVDPSVHFLVIIGQ